VGLVLWCPSARRFCRKLLGFTDNRQDAALQAGNFNDFLFVSLLRAAILAAVRKAGAAGLTEQDFGRSVQAALGFTAVNRERRQEWMLDPEAKGVPQVNAEQALSRVLAYRVWADQPADGASPTGETRSADAASSISLKRSTTNLQLTTSSPADYPSNDCLSDLVVAPDLET
jgi:hypothetical protein